MTVDDVLALGDVQTIIAGYRERLAAFEAAAQAFTAAVIECNRLKEASDATAEELAPWSRAVDLLLEARRVVIQSN